LLSLKSVDGSFEQLKAMPDWGVGIGHGVKWIEQGNKSDEA
jgi:hypothetical protein